MIHTAIQKAYDQFALHKWEHIYFALDVHGTVASPDYKAASRELYDVVVEPLQVISRLPEVQIILFTCCQKHDYPAYYKLFERYGIRIFRINDNPAVANTKTGCFDKKFYFNILADDKAGFEPWMFPSVRDAFLNARQFNTRVHELYGDKAASKQDGAET